MSGEPPSKRAENGRAAVRNYNLPQSTTCEVTGLFRVDVPEIEESASMHEESAGPRPRRHEEGGRETAHAPAAACRRTTVM